MKIETLGTIWLARLTRRKCGHGQVPCGDTICIRIWDWDWEWWNISTSRISVAVARWFCPSDRATLNAVEALTAFPSTIETARLSSENLDRLVVLPLNSLSSESMSMCLPPISFLRHWGVDSFPLHNRNGSPSSENLDRSVLSPSHSLSNELIMIMCWHPFSIFARLATIKVFMYINWVIYWYYWTWSMAVTFGEMR